MAPSKHRQPRAPAELSLLRSRALLIVMNFTRYEPEPYFYTSMELFFKDYRAHRDLVKAAFLEMFNYLKHHATVKVKPEKFTFAKQEINKAARAVWKRRK